MPHIIPIKNLRNTTEISELAHSIQEPIFITKNGYSDLVVMSAELYDKFALESRIDYSIMKAEAEVISGENPVDAREAIEKLEKKYIG